MDDLILKAAIWQEEHWVDRSAMLKYDRRDGEDVTRAVKVVLLSLDRNRQSLVFFFFFLLDSQLTLVVFQCA